MKKYILLFLFLVYTLGGFGQGIKNLRQRHILINKDSIHIDSLIILPSSFCLYDKNILVNDSLYTLDINKGLLICTKLMRKRHTTLRVKYRCLNYSVNQKIAIRNKKVEAYSNKNTHKYSFGSTNKHDYESASRINKEGSYVRGFSIGNNQDMMIKSSLNLRLNGILKDSIRISAVISDNNVPLQSSGNTRDIQEFDRIYIKVYDNKQSLLLGDYISENRDGYYSRFKKKSQGGKYTISTKLNGGMRLNSEFNVAISKGKYNKLTLNTIEGVQGPYPLYGKNNERYIIVLSDSEAVYLNGELLVRGESNDYTIDYNRSEITFTTKRIINTNSRIVVEYEYSEDKYARFFLYNKNVFENKDIKFWLNTYIERDNKNKSLGRDISKNDKSILMNIGDNNDLIIQDNVDSVSYDVNKILYKRINKGSLSDPDYIYKYSTNRDSAFYNVRFVFAGKNKGDYKELLGFENGKVYEWVSTKEGVKQGSYTCKIRLRAPQSLNLLNGGVLYKFSENIKSQLELSYSNKDNNTFSSKDDYNNTGIAINSKTESVHSFKNCNLSLTNKLQLEYISSKFRNIESYRSIEFSRDWNLRSLAIFTDQNLIKLSTLFSNKNWGKTSYSFSYYRIKDHYRANKHDYGILYKYKYLSFNMDVNWLLSNDDLYSSNFIREHGTIKYNKNKLSLGVGNSKEYNKWIDNNNFLLNSNSFENSSYDIFAKTLLGNKSFVSIFYKNRTDKYVYKNKFMPLSKSEDIGCEFVLSKKSNNIKGNINYRKYSMLGKLNIANKNEDTFIGKIDYKLRIKKSFIYSSIYYDIGSGLESIKDYKFIELAPGQGSYLWIDYNKNNIQELNEFELAHYKDEAKYIKVSISSRRYYRVYTKTYKHSIGINPKVLLKKSNLFIKYFTNKTSLSINQKTGNSDFFKYANPISNSIKDDDLILRSQINNIFSYKSKTNKLRISYKYIISTDFQKLNINTIINKFRENSLVSNLGLGSMYMFKSKTNVGANNHYDSVFGDKSYNIYFVHNYIGIKVQSSIRCLFGLYVKLKREINTLGIEKLLSTDLSFSYTQSFGTKGKLGLEYNYIKIRLNSTDNKSISYVMLKGLQVGNNSLLSIYYRHKLSKILDVNTSYTGRYSEGNKLIHTGNVEIRANF